jgi:UrcA family protein
MKWKGGNCAGVVLITAVVFTTGAMAKPEPDATVVIETQSLRYSPVHVAEPAGAAELYARMRVVARKVCARLWTGQHRPLANAVAERECADRAISDAVAAINLPAVTVVHMQKLKTGDTAVTAVAKR